MPSHGEVVMSPGGLHIMLSGVSKALAVGSMIPVKLVFQDHALPKGEMLHRGKRIDPAAITDIAILAIEGERDDISGIGQTKAALKISTGLPDAKKQYFLAPGAGHYGIFNGSKWRDTIAPVVEAWIADHN